MCSKCCTGPLLRALWRPIADGRPGHTDEGDAPQAVACLLKMVYKTKIYGHAAAKVMYIESF